MVNVLKILLTIEVQELLVFLSFPFPYSSLALRIKSDFFSLSIYPAHIICLFIL